MNRFYFLFIATFFSFQQINAQAVNDDCETAIDITDQFIESDEFRYCYTGDDIVHSVVGSFIVDLREASVGNINYNYISNNCVGYTDTTSSTYPDVWFKLAPKDTSINKLLSYDLFALLEDTTHIAFYYGSCQELYQLSAYTFLPVDFENEDYYQRFNFSWGITRSMEDSIYIQIRSPRRDVSDICISDFRVLNMIPFYNYEHLAINANTATSTNEYKNSSITTLFPNPTDGFLELQLDANVATVDVEVRFYSLVGQQVARFEGQTAFDLSGLAKGVYVAEVVLKGQVLGREKVLVTD